MLGQHTLTVLPCPYPSGLKSVLKSPGPLNVSWTTPAGQLGEWGESGDFRKGNSMEKNSPELRLFTVHTRNMQPRRIPRVLMHLHDAGADGYSQWVCPSCERTTEVWFENQDWPSSYSEPCPWCGPVWGRLEASRKQELADFSHVEIYGPSRPNYPAYPTKL
jgi:predicted RNA-binding Zn-ribbon protein involved in translation (DUF1610 family)